ncbi:MAG: hypothetical protein QG653_624 [Patescibacteria group bacterium]|nr:hypothetical protein [Patescibacteria group bacterium]
MKKIFLLTLLLSPLPLLAQEATSTEPLVTTQAVSVANVNLSNARINQISTSTYTVSFSLTAPDEKQDNIRYGISLSHDDGTPVATYTFDKKISLEKGSSTPITENIDVPKGLSGTFAVLVRALTENGLPLGFGIAGTIELNDTELVKITDCVTDEESYTKNEVLQITCSVKEVKKGVLTSMENGGYVIKAKAFYGNNPKEVQVAFAEIVNNKAILELKGLTDPGTYTIYSSLYERSGSNVGKEFNTLFSVNGVKVSIMNTLLDKDMYKEGDTANATISLGLVVNGVSPILTLTGKLTGKDGSCADDSVREPTQGAIQISMPIKKTCLDPTFSVLVTDQTNTIIASSSLSLTSTIKNEPIKSPELSTNKTDKMIYGGTGLLGLLFGLVSVFIARRKFINTSQPQQV